MKFLVDAQLPKRLSDLLQTMGFDAVHTLDLPGGNQTPDGEINRLSLEQRRVVITKDADFVDSFLLQKQPHQLLIVGTGNIRNDDLIDRFQKEVPRMVDLFLQFDYLELTVHSLLIRG